ncbi:MAG: deoxyribodipyrimidine photo-lyase, partial [bacterium]
MATESGPESGRGGGRAEVCIVWFRGTDLRVHDNSVLSKAVDSLQRNESAGIVPLFCYDPRWFAASR